VNDKERSLQQSCKYTQLSKHLEPRVRMWRNDKGMHMQLTVVTPDKKKFVSKVDDIDTTWLEFADVKGEPKAYYSSESQAIYYMDKCQWYDATSVFPLDMDESPEPHAVNAAMGYGKTCIAMGIDPYPDDEIEPEKVDKKSFG
jgi:hypothetical protein